MVKKEFLIEKKLAVLAVIKEKKDVLFGNFKNTTNIEKRDAWEEVLDKAKSLELASADKKWTYARDGLFGLWKCRTLVSMASRLCFLS